MSEFKAIETSYKGYRFRSRLEARWAVYMDALGVRWEYEKQGFDLEGIAYLPDFWLPEAKLWLEVKGIPLMDSAGDEVEKARLLCLATRNDTQIAYGPPTIAGEDDHCILTWKFKVPNEEEVRDLLLSWQSAPNMQARVMERAIRYGGIAEMDVIFLPDAEDVRAAIIAARSARFEHGETPQTDR